MSQPEAHSSATEVDSKKTFTSAERIKELNKIDEATVSLLRSASEAVKLLANSSSSSPSDHPSLESRQEAFLKHSSEYFATLSSIDVRLRRQAYALEEAGLIAAGTERDAKRGRAVADDNQKVTGGGPLDTSWLNAQASKTVERGMDRQIWTQAREIAEKIEIGKT